jgi:hypothetical protein
VTTNQRIALILLAAIGIAVAAYNSTSEVHVNIELDTIPAEDIKQ